MTLYGLLVGLFLFGIWVTFGIKKTRKTAVKAAESI